MDEEAVSLLYGNLELVQIATSIPKEPDKNLKLVQKKYKLCHNWQVQFAPILKEGDEIFLDRPSLLRSAAEKHVSDGYNKLFSNKEG